MTPEQINDLLNTLHAIRISLYFILGMTGAIFGSGLTRR